MQIARKSPFTGKVNTMEISVTEEQMEEVSSGRWLIQDILHNLTADEREFIMTGYTQEDWDNMFADEEGA